MKNAIKNFVNKKLNKLSEKYNISIEFDKVEIRHVNKFRIKSITIESPNRFKLSINEIDITVDIIKLVRIRNIYESTHVNIEQGELFIEKERREDLQNRKDNLVNSSHSKSIYSFYKQISSFLFEGHGNLRIFNFKLFFLDNCVTCMEIVIDKNYISAEVELIGNTFDIGVAIDRNHRSLTLTEILFKLKSDYLEFSKMNLSFKETFDDELAEFTISISSTIDELFIHHRMLDAKRLFFEKVSFDVELKLSYNQFRVTENSFINIGAIPIAFQLTLNMSKPSLISGVVAMSLDDSSFSQVFSGFMNKGINSIKFSGGVIVFSSFKVLLNNPLQQIFKIIIEENDIEIHEISEFDLFYLNNPFQHIIEKDSEFIKTIYLKDNIREDFVTIDEVSPVFVDCLVLCEDPNFYKHNGFDDYFFGKAIATNLINRKFVRGASTITMQTVKNLFLNNDRTIMRKVEEIVIALLIENYFKISKRRILEIYLNIIEFAPKVYGIKDASNFYFSIDPSSLSITQSIVITYIIPRPKHFYEALLLKTEQLCNNLQKYFEKTARNLVENNLITEDQYNNLDTKIVFSHNLGEISLKAINAKAF